MMSIGNFGGHYRGARPWLSLLHLPQASDKIGAMGLELGLANAHDH